MIHAYSLQTNVTAGELSPRMMGRVDVTRYGNGCSHLENFIIQPQGGIYRRPGTRYIGQVRDMSKKGRLIPFIFSTIQTYMLEFSDGLVTFYKDGGTIVHTGTITAVVSNGSGLCRVTSANHKLNTGSRITITGVAGASSTNGTWTITKISDNTFDLNGSVFSGAYTSGGTFTWIGLEVPYLIDELASIYYTQSADVLYLVHPNYSPRKISRTGDTSWTLEEIEFLDGPYLTENTTDTTLTASASTGTGVTLTASSLVGINNGAGFGIHDEGRVIRLRTDSNDKSAVRTGWISSAANNGSGLIRIGSNDHKLSSGQIVTVSNVGGVTNANGTFEIIQVNANYFDLVGSTFAGTYTASTGQWETSNLVGWCRILSVDAVDKVKVDIQARIPATGTTKWRLGAWSNETGWPRVCTFNQERLCMGNTTTQPQTIWMSKSADFENFAPTEDDLSVLDDASITVTMASSKVESIQWMEPAMHLFVGTTGGEWIISAGRLDSPTPITPTTIFARSQTNLGSVPVRPARVGTSIMFIQRGGRKLRETGYSFEKNSYTAKDISIVSEHLMRQGGSCTVLDYQQEPDSVIWVVRGDGQLIGVTYLDDQQVIGWHQHVLGGSFNGGDPVVESLAVIPNDETGNDEVWMIVKRTVSGATVRYIEVIQDPFAPENEDDKDGMFFVDCGLTYDGAPATVISGLDHLEGEEVQVVADGAHVGNKTVSGGSITLGTAASVVQVGLPYVSRMQTLRLEAASPGTAQGKRRRPNEVTLRFLDSLTVKYGRNLDKLDTLPFRKTSDPMDSSPPLFTGDQIVSLNNGYDLDGQFWIVQDKPYPCTLLAWIPETGIYG